MRRAICALALAAIWSCDPMGPIDGGLDADVDAGDGALDSGGSADAGPDADVPDSATLDGAVFDADVSIDSGALDDGSICTCEMIACQICQPELGCSQTNAPDGTECVGGRCYGGTCTVGGCGDGYREPGPDPAREGCDDGNAEVDDACDACTPQVLVIASRAGEEELPATVSVAEDDSGELLFLWSETVGEELHLRGRRYTGAGAPLEAAFGFGGDLGRGWDPDAAVVGLASGWAVVWAEQGADASEAGIRYALVPPTGPAGSPRRANQFELGRQAAPAIARTGSGFLVAWADESGTMTLPGRSRLRQRSFDLSGRAESDELALSPDGQSAREVFLAANAGALLAVWTRDAIVPFARPTVVGRRIAGESTDATPFTISGVDGDGAQPTAAFLDTGDIAVAWVSRGDDPRGDVRARVVHGVGDALDGTVVTPLTWTPMTVPPTENVAEVAPRVLPLTAGEFLVTYEDGGARRGVGVAGSSPVAAEYPTLLGHLRSGLQGDVTLLSTARGLWFAWSDAGGIGVSGAQRSFLAYLLPPS